MILLRRTGYSRRQRWHEFEDFEWTDEDATDKREISKFLNEIKKGYEV
ncbi:hypothetical protein [Algoriphagus faecimaris]|nr:hypothetical protein [Algoriphagus faecimaris]